MVNIDGFEYKDSDIPDYVRSLFRYINDYQPRELDIDYRLKTFLPKFCPAVGDVDAMLKVINLRYKLLFTKLLLS